MWCSFSSMCITMHGSENVKFGTGTRYGLEGPGIEFRCRLDFPHPWIGSGAHSASFTMGTGSFLGVKQSGRGVDHPPPPSSEVKERLELYLYSHFGPSWPVLGWPLPLPSISGLISSIRSARMRHAVVTGTQCTKPSISVSLFVPGFSGNKCLMSRIVLLIILSGTEVRALCVSCFWLSFCPQGVKKNRYAAEIRPTNALISNWYQGTQTVLRSF